MKPATLSLALLLAALAAVTSPSTPRARRAVQQPGGSAVGKTVKVVGSAKINRPGLRESVVVRRNMQVFAGDRISVEQEASVKIICFAGLVHTQLTPGEHEVNCPAPAQAADDITPILNRGREKVSTIKGPDGKVLTPRANEYSLFLVKIINSRPAAWSTSVTLDRSLDNEKRDNLVRRIRDLPADADEKRLLLAEVYAMNMRYDRAVEQLRGVAGAESDPFVHLFLGDLYLARNLGLDAKRAYAAAVAAAVAAGDRLGEAYAQHALGLVLLYEDARVETATSALRRAVLLYTELGEVHAAGLVQAELTPPPTPSPTPATTQTGTPTPIPTATSSPTPTVESVGRQISGRRV